MSKEIVLDVSELEAPQPLLQAITAIKDLKSDEELLFIHRMFPCKLQEQIDALGLSSQILENKENHFKMKIFH
jgi:hypothetical protein